MKNTRKWMNDYPLTDLEKEVIQQAVDQGSYYEEDVYGAGDLEEEYLNGETDEFTALMGVNVLEDSPDARILRGALSSLIKKGLVEVYEEEGAHPRRLEYFAKRPIRFKKEGYHQIDW